MLILFVFRAAKILTVSYKPTHFYYFFSRSVNLHIFSWKSLKTLVFQPLHPTPTLELSAFQRPLVLKNFVIGDANVLPLSKPPNISSSFL